MAGQIQMSNITMNPRRTQAKLNRGRILAIFIFLFIIIFHFIYGFQSRFYQLENPQQASSSIPLLLMSTVFALLGFGLLLSAYRRTKLSGLAIALLVVAFNFLLGPLFQQLWFHAFLSWLTGDVNVIAPNAPDFWLRFSQSAVTPSDLTFRLSNLCSVSFLIVITGMIGRISFSGVFMLQILYNTLWYLNLNLNILISHQENVDPLVYFDDYGTYVVYLYGAVTGLIICLINQTSRQIIKRTKRDRVATLFTVLGSVFLLCTFSFTYVDIIKLSGTSAIYKANAMFINTLFSVIASTCGVYCGSLLLNKGKVGIAQATLGIISGGVMVGSIAGYFQNIGAMLFLGFIAGFLIAVIMNTVVYKLNYAYIFDSQGFIIPILIVTFLGGFIVAPATIFRHFSLGSTYNALGGQKQTQYRAAGYQLAYFGVSFIISLVTGIIGGLTLKATREPYSDYSDFKIFATDFGLYQQEEQEQGVQQVQQVQQVEQKSKQVPKVQGQYIQNESNKNLKADVI